MKDNRRHSTDRPPLVSVIILNWDGKKFLADCLDAVFRQTWTGMEVIMVDNGSRDGSVEFVRERYGDSVRVVENGENVGFAEGNNRGISVSRGRYIALLNNDACPETTWLEEMVRVMEGDSRVGICACKIVCADNPRIIDYAGFLIYRDGTVRSRGRLEEDRGQYSRQEETFAASGCALLYRRAMLDEVGLFDPDFFIYGDDSELGFRARLAGWKAIFVPSSVVYHIGSATTGVYSPFKAFLVERNRLWLTVKYFPLSDLLLSPVFILLRFAYQAYGALTHQGTAGRFAEEYSQLELLKILFKAYWAAVKKLPVMWGKRKRIAKLKKVSTKEVRSWFRRFGISVKELTMRE